MADEKDIAAEEEGGGGGKKKLIIVIVGVVLLLTIAGGSAFFLLGGAEQAGAEGGGAGAEALAEADEADPVYHKLDPTFVVNLPPGGSAKMLQVAIQVMTREPDLIDTLEANDPMIRHHLLDLLEQQQASELLKREGREALQKAIEKLLGEKLEQLRAPGKIRGVFFTQFVMQ